MCPQSFFVSKIRGGNFMNGSMANLEQLEKNNLSLKELEQYLVDTSEREADKTRCIGPKVIVEKYKDLMSGFSMQHYNVLLLDRDKYVIKNVSLPSNGNVENMPSPRQVLDIAMKYNASSIIFMHNHPLSDPIPSKEDREYTDRLISSSRLRGIKVMDHFIFGNKRHFSFAEKYLI